MTTESPRRHRHLFPGWRRSAHRKEPAPACTAGPPADSAAQPPADPDGGAGTAGPAGGADIVDPAKPVDTMDSAEQRGLAGPGTVRPAAGETAILDAFSVRPDEPLAAGMAVLMVIRPLQERGVPQFVLRGFCGCCDVMDFPGRYDRPGLALDCLASEEGEPPATILSLMKSWSSTKFELNEWLARHGDLDLVIWDNTGYRIPWELLWLEHPPGCKLQHPPGCRGDWLGGVVTVTRWLQIRKTSHQANRSYGGADQCTGPVMYCIDPMFSGDNRLLNGLRGEAKASVRELANALESGGDPLSLVYVAVEGQFGEQISQCWLGDLPLVHFDSQRLFRLAGAPAFVFLNACHSGGLSHDTARLNDGFLRGFAEVFLRSGAAGVLATSGRVGTATAFEMARAVLERMRKHPGVPVARIVRDLRGEAASRIPADLASVEGPDAHRQLLPLLYTFMYVCYGSPRTTVSPDLDGGTS